MKTHMGLWMLLVPAVVASAQENDDLYFRSKDRQNATPAATESFVSNYNNFKRQHFPEAFEQEGNINPTDSYSARQVNPEYVSRASSGQASEDDQNYFVEGYSSAGNQNQVGNNAFNNSMNNWHVPGWYGPARFNNWYSPYFGFYDPWMNPFWNPGWNMGFNNFGGGWGGGWNMGFNNFGGGWGGGWNMMMGNSWGNAWGGPMWGNAWGNPMWGNVWGGPMWGNAWGPMWGNGWGFGNWERSRVQYGRRPTGNSIIAGNVRSNAPNNSRNPVDYVRTRNSNVTGNPGGRTSGNGVVDNPGGRTSGNGVVNNRGSRPNVNDEYYVRPSRRAVNEGSYSNFGESINRSRSQSREMFNHSPQNRNSGWHDSRPSFSPSRGSSFPSGGTRMSAPSSGSRSRGRN